MKLIDNANRNKKRMEFKRKNQDIGKHRIKNVEVIRK